MHGITIRHSEPILPGISPFHPAPRGLRFHRFYTVPGIDPFEDVTWETRDFGDFQVEAPVEVPAFWSDNAVRIVAAQYFRRLPGGARERSVREMVRRVTGTLPESATPEDVQKIFLAGWKLKLKAVAVYRDGVQAQPAGVGRIAGRSSFG